MTHIARAAVGVVDRLSRRIWGRLILAGLVFWIAAALYVSLNAALGSRFDFMTPLDGMIPLLPWTLIVYWSWLLFVGAGVILLKGREFIGLLTALLVVSLACFALFTLFPAHYPRPALDEIPPAWRGLFSWLHRTDGPGNTFPSLHVALTTLTGLRLRTRRLGWLWLGLAVLISASTLTVKQHFVLDFVAGAALAGAAHLVLGRRDVASQGEVR